MARGSTPADPARPTVHIVEAGETLWGIAREVVGEEGDPRPLIHRIRAVNGLELAALHPGRRLTIPEI